VLSLVCYLLTNLSPGGMITPGWIAVILIQDPSHSILLLGTVVVTYFVVLRVRKVVILYGKRLFASVVMVAVFIQIGAFLFFLRAVPNVSDNSTLGFIVPGLIAYQLIRQPIGATLTALVTVTSISYSLVLTGILMGFIPRTKGTEGLTDVGGTIIHFSVLRLALTVVIAGLGLVLMAASIRRVGRTPDRGLEEGARL
jgi:gamma-polyglutamate biosynthesis protein CapC